MFAKYISKTPTDLTSVNAARVSMGASRKAFDDSDKKGSDKRLLRFLAREVHFTPFTHIRVTFLIEAKHIRFGHMSDTDTAGLVKDHRRGMIKMRHSIYGWANLIKKELLDPAVCQALAYDLWRLFPHNAEALQITTGAPTGAVTHVADHTEKDRRFMDVTLHIKCPFFVARQEFKHIVGFARNEISRRYVETSPEFHTMVWRSRPEGNIKQGSGGLLSPFKSAIASVVAGLVNWTAYGAYKALLWLDVAPEQARSVLPQSTYTEYHVTASLAAYSRLVHLRTDKTAQVEIQELACMINKAIRKAHNYD